MLVQSIQHDEENEAIMKVLQQVQHTEGAPSSTVYFTKDISPQGLVAIYKALGAQPQGKVAVKISSGEMGGNYYLHPDLIGELVQSVDGTIVECCTAYGGSRQDIRKHWDTIEAHGFKTIAPVDIMDEEGDMLLPVVGGTYLQEDYVGDHLLRYGFMINLAHFKGHQMGGFGGVLKNQSIGVASSRGKSWIHSAGTQQTGYAPETDKDAFIYSMAEAASAVADHFGENIVYIDVMNNLSIDCDCDSNPAKPEIADIGILSSTDPVALDQACYDLVSKAPGNAKLMARIEDRHGLGILVHAEELGMGTRNYELITIDK